MLYERKPAERAVDDAAAQLRWLLEHEPQKRAAIRTARDRLDVAWRQLHRLRAGGY